jgi:CrcB protein
MLEKSLMVALGSVVGGLARWGVYEALTRQVGRAFPWATLGINLVGSFILGWFMARWGERGSENLRLLVAVGFTGSFTTFSAFEYETNSLLGGAQYLSAAAYVAASVFLGLLAVRGGAMLGR